MNILSPVLGMPKSDVFEFFIPLPLGEGRVRADGVKNPLTCPLPKGEGKFFLMLYQFVRVARCCGPGRTGMR